MPGYWHVLLLSFPPAFPLNPLHGECSRRVSRNQQRVVPSKACRHKLNGGFMKPQAIAIKRSTLVSALLVGAVIAICSATNARAEGVVKQFIERASIP